MKAFKHEENVEHWVYKIYLTQFNLSIENLSIGYWFQAWNFTKTIGHLSVIREV